jgi:hypothetical protein
MKRILLICLTVISGCSNNEQSDDIEEQRRQIEREAWLIKSHQIDSIKHIKDSMYNASPERIGEKERNLAKVKKAKEDSVKLNGIRIKYSCDQIQALAIANGQVAIGMTKVMCTGAWGNPHDIHRSTSARGTTEQWIYGLTNYLYFSEDGLLSYIQN